jgi:hypothetical protein
MDFLEMLSLYDSCNGLDSWNSKPFNIWCFHDDEFDYIFQVAK